ncbi:hypothetical protein P4910_21355 [Pantoea stewartii]|uniref:hypothetical protein n=1 Tax=Pantoea stewartii TaxID=66269 RepID=UPI0023F995CA|nr:hypothetical protein [Pantoea stewartii]MDF7788001.1 hypothetical protein [Pantoea stewartii]
MKKYLSIAILSLVIAGCSSIGGEDKFSRNYLNSHIIPNKTTQSEVRSLYGAPREQMAQSNGNSQWFYMKGSNTSSALGILGFIPGGAAFSQAVSVASTANAVSNTIPSSKLHSDTDQHGDALYINFDKNNVVTSWSM